MNDNNSSPNFFFPLGENCESHSSDHMVSQASKEMASLDSNGPQISSEYVGPQQSSNEKPEPNVVVPNFANEQDGMDLDLPFSDNQTTVAVPNDHEISSSEVQDSNDILSDLNFEKSVNDYSPYSQTFASPAASGVNKPGLHPDILETFSPKQALPQDSLDEPIELKSTLVTESTTKSMESTFNAPETSLQADCPPAASSPSQNKTLPPGSQEAGTSDVKGDSSSAVNYDVSPMELTATSDRNEDLQPDLQDAGVSDVQGGIIPVTNHDADYMKVAETEGYPNLTLASSSDPSPVLAVEETVVLQKSTDEGRKLEDQHPRSKEVNLDDVQITNVVDLDQREVFYSGSVKESHRNKEMRFIKEESLVKKNSHIIKAQAAGTIREKIPDIPIMPRISRTTPQLFFAFLYLLTQRDWAKYHSDRLCNKMGFFEDLLDWFKYPSSVRHLVTKKTFLAQLQKDMITCAFQLWKEENPPLGVREKKEGKKEPVWRAPPRLPNDDKEFSEFDDVTVPFYVWHIREDQELLALTELLLKKTEFDEKNDAEKVAKGQDATRLSLRTRRLLRLVTKPDKLLDKIYSIRFKMDEMVVDMEANAPIDPLAPENEEEFIDLYTYFMPKPPDEMAAIREAEKERLELEEAAIADLEALAAEEEADILPIAPKRNKQAKRVSNYGTYPLPPSMRMQMAAHKIGQEAKRPAKVSQVQQNPSKIKKKSKQKKKEVTWERPVRASKLRAGEKLAESFAAHAQYVEQLKNGGMDEEEYNDMSSFAYQVPKNQANDAFESANSNGLYHQNSTGPANNSQNAQRMGGYETPRSPELFYQEPVNLRSTQASFPQDEYMDESQSSKPRKQYYDNEDDDDLDYDDQEYGDDYDENQYGDGFALTNTHHPVHLQTGFGDPQNHHNSGFAQPGHNNQQAYNQFGLGPQQHTQAGYELPTYYPPGQYPQSMHQPGYHVQGQYQSLPYLQDFSQQAFVPQAYSQQVYSQQPYSQNTPVPHPLSQQPFLPQPFGQQIPNSQVYNQLLAYAQPIQSLPQLANYEPDEDDDNYEQADYNDEDEAQLLQHHRQSTRSLPGTYHQSEKGGNYEQKVPHGQDDVYEQDYEEEESNQLPHTEGVEQISQSPEDSPLSERPCEDTPNFSPSLQYRQPSVQNPALPPYRPNTPDLQSSSFNSNPNHHFQPTNLPPFSPPDQNSSQSTPSKRLILTYNPHKTQTSNFPFPNPPLAPKPAHAKLPGSSRPVFATTGIDYSAVKSRNGSFNQPTLNVRGKKSGGGRGGNKKRKLSDSVMADDLGNVIEPDDSADEDYAGPGAGSGGKKRKRGGTGGSGGKKSVGGGKGRRRS